MNKKKISLKRIKRGFLVPFLLILSFLVFIIIPDQIGFWCHVTSTKIPDEMLLFFGVMFPLSLISDALIYIFGQRHIRVYLRRMVKDLR